MPGHEDVKRTAAIVVRSLLAALRSTCLAGVLVLAGWFVGRLVACWPVVTPVELKDLPDFEGLLFQVDVDEAEDAVIPRQVQMFFWPWEDDESPIA
jgi:hypothetical protein